MLGIFISDDYKDFINVESLKCGDFLKSDIMLSV